MTIVLAAGGVVHRTVRGRLRYAIVHRTRHRDWVLPKGKLEPAEGFCAAAVREVREEAACDATIESWAGVIAYTLTDGSEKMVVFYDMHCDRTHTFARNDEIDALEWVTPDVAVARLNYADERRLLQRVSANPPPCTRRPAAD